MNGAWDCAGYFELSCPVCYKVDLGVLAGSCGHALVSVKGNREPMGLAGIMIF